MLWSLIEAMMMKIKLFLGQNIGFSKKITSRKKCEVKTVVAAIDNSDHYTFNNYQTV